MSLLNHIVDRFHNSQKCWPSSRRCTKQPPTTCPSSTDAPLWWLPRQPPAPSADFTSDKTQVKIRCDSTTQKRSYMLIPTSDPELHDSRAWSEEQKRSQIMTREPNRTANLSGLGYRLYRSRLSKQKTFNLQQLSRSITFADFCTVSLRCFLIGIPTFATHVPISKCLLDSAECGWTF